MKKNYVYKISNLCKKDKKNFYSIIYNEIIIDLDTIYKININERF